MNRRWLVESGRSISGGDGERKKLRWCSEVKKDGGEMNSEMWVLNEGG